MFCLNHRATNKHRCPKADFDDNKVFKCPICLMLIRVVPDEDINMTWARHSSNDCDPRRRDIERKKRLKKKKDRCNKCRAKLNTVTRMHCERCGLDFCVKHRLPSNHECGEIKKKKKSVGDHNRIPKVSCKEVVETCPQCGAQFPSVESLMIHFHHAHDDDTKTKRKTRKKSCILS